MATVYFSGMTETAKEVFTKIKADLKAQVARDKQAVPKHYNEEMRKSYLEHMHGFENSLRSLFMQAEKIVTSNQDIANILNLFNSQPVTIKDTDGVYENVNGYWHKKEEK